MIKKINRKKKKSLRIDQRSSRGEREQEVLIVWLRERETDRYRHK